MRLQGSCLADVALDYIDSVGVLMVGNGSLSINRRASSSFAAPMHPPFMVNACLTRGERRLSHA